MQFRAVIHTLRRSDPLKRPAEPGADRHGGRHRRVWRGQRQRLLSGIVASAAIILAAGTASAAPGNAMVGKHDFGRCGVCHSIKKGVNKFGPSLHCIVGRRAATAPNYRYSNSLKELGAKGVRWNQSNLFAYLNNPHAYLERTLGKSSIHNKMTMKFHGKTFRQDVIAYLAAHACD